MSVSKVSFDEINAVRDLMPAKPQVETVTHDQSNKQDIRYIDKFSDKKIADFFTPYGYITHERSEDGSTVLVLCDGCQIIFDDFSVMVEPHVNLFAEDTVFNFEQFSNLCEQANITPSQAIQDRLEDEIFNSMPYYVERKRKFTVNNLKNIAKNNQFGELLRASTEKQMHRENLASLNKTYGSSNPEKIADTLARLNPNK